jgi:hypothetical protein
MILDGMTYDIEIMLRGDERVYTEQVHHIGNEPDDWTVEDASTLLHSVLKAIDRVLNPERGDEPSTAVRGVNWIVTLFDGQPVVAIEIHSASAVAGPVPIDRGRLESLLEEAVKSPVTSSGVVH